MFYQTNILKIKRVIFELVYKQRGKRKLSNVPKNQIKTKRNHKSYVHLILRGCFMTRFKNPKKEANSRLRSVKYEQYVELLTFI